MVGREGSVNILDYLPEEAVSIELKSQNKREALDEMVSVLSSAHKIKDSDRSLGSIFKILLEEITAFNGQNRFCVKFPLYVNYIPMLMQWFPKCRVIHIIRDPRAITASKTNDPDGTGAIIRRYPYLRFLIRKIMIFFVIMQYIWSSKLHCKFKKYENYALFKYEDLLVDQEIVIKDLCQFA